MHYDQIYAFYRATESEAEEPQPNDGIYPSRELAHDFIPVGTL